MLCGMFGKMNGALNWLQVRPAGIHQDKDRRDCQPQQYHLTLEEAAGDL